ncbi:MAG: bifunctional transaldolase/phosoglucose isomerase [Anaerolineae bacterium]|nr:bifunctional transaldolase/phosoglucose isomerase [Anaerolineae bacterium]
MSANPPVDVQQYGQSIWYDNIRRNLIENGELQRMINEDGVLGVTSNPSIFQRAIGGSEDYDDGMMQMLELDPYDIYERLAIQDIQHALDILRPVYDSTGGRDGYVSLEVSPLIANDTASTIAEARRLFATLGRPNAMIKIPATEAGIPAIEEAIASGLNINVTLIFSIQNYEQVMEAYIRGLERRKANGEDISHISSVASFFVSRIDSAVDRILDNNIRAAQGRDLGRVSLNNRLKGKAAIANAKLAYKRFKEIFNSPRFEPLREAGARVQRPLWASTGTKSASLSDTVYVDSLIGPHTVNTVPPATLQAFKDHGTVTASLEMDVEDALQTMDMLAEVGVDIDQITYQLQVDGVEAFSEAFHNLLDQVDAKRNVLATGVIKRQSIAIGPYQQEVQRVIQELEAHHINTRIWEHDGTVWKDHPAIVSKIQNRLGWLDVFETIDLARLKLLQESAKNGVFDHVVLLGMGGSSLAPEVLSQTFGLQEGYPRLHMLDSTDPTYIRELEDAIDLQRSLFIVSSKSGGTIETASFFKYFYEKTGQSGAQFIAITDGGTQLEAEARDKGFRDVFVNPTDIGGRYSALSYFGMVPAALIGLDLDALWSSATQMAKACGKKISGSDHPGITLGAVMGVLGMDGRDKVSIFTSPSIETLGNWIEQLIAESTGKEGRGLLPVVGATIGMPHDYATDRLFIMLRVDEDDNASLDEGVKMLLQAGQPCVTIKLPNKAAVGGEFMRWEYATAIAGQLLGINPFDEPNVTESKENTARLLAHYKEHGALPATEPILSVDGVSLYADTATSTMLRETAQQQHYDPDLNGMLATLINNTHAGDYFALLAYLPMEKEIETTLSDIRRRIRHVTRRATTIGFGPRFLHSTGQLHKGGPNNGVFIQITCDDPQDLAIPGETYTFGVLKAAQAAGDMEALVGKNRRAIRLHLSGDIQAGLEKLRSAVDLAGERRP